MSTAHIKQKQVDISCILVRYFIGQFQSSRKKIWIQFQRLERESAWSASHIGVFLHMYMIVRKATKSSQYSAPMWALGILAFLFRFFIFFFHFCLWSATWEEKKKMRSTIIRDWLWILMWLCVIGPSLCECFLVCCSNTKRNCEWLPA